MKDIVNTMAEWYKVLGDPTRLKLIRLLASNPERSLCVGSLAKRLGVTQPAVSQHLRVLKSFGLVEPNRAGYHVHYTINVDVLRDYNRKSDELFKMVFEECPECEERDECAT